MNQNDSELSLRDTIQIILRRRWVVIMFFIIVVSVTVIATFRQKPLYETSATILIERRSPAVVSFKEINGLAGDDSTNRHYYETQYTLIKSQSLLESVAQKLDWYSSVRADRDRAIRQALEVIEQRKKSRPKQYSKTRKSRKPSAGDPVQRLAKIIKVAPIKNTQLVKISVEYTDPVQAAKIVNTLIDEYIRANHERNDTIAQHAARWLDQSIEVQRRKLRDSERQLQEYRQLHHINVLPEMGGEEATENIKAEYAKLQALYDNYAQRYTEDHPAIIELKAQIQSLRNRIQGLEDDRGSSSAMEYRVLEREVRLNKQLYEVLVNRLKEIDLTSTMQLSNVNVIDRADVPRRPSKPRIVFNILLAVFGGIFGGIALCFLVDDLDMSVKSTEDVKKLLGYHFLGAIPTMEEKDDLKKDRIVHDEPRAPVAEAYRAIRTAVCQLLEQKNKLKTILITSAEIQAGKTMTVSNLGTVLAQRGHRVLLVDSDLRKPQLHKIFNLDRHHGLNEYLLGEETLEHLIKDTDDQGLKVVTGGRSPTHPAEIISNGRMEQFIQEVRETFDYVLFDSPPIISVTDSMILADKLDASLVVIRSNKALIPCALRAKEQLEQTKTVMLGAILNDVKASYGYYPYYRYYYYGESKRRRLLSRRRIVRRNKEGAVSDVA